MGKQTGSRLGSFAELLQAVTKGSPEHVKGSDGYNPSMDSGYLYEPEVISISPNGAPVLPGQ